jgi:hypothetical protein
MSVIDWSIASPSTGCHVHPQSVETRSGRTSDASMAPSGMSSNRTSDSSSSGVSAPSHTWYQFCP